MKPTDFLSYAFMAGLALNFGALLAIVIGSMKNKQKRFILPFMAIWLALLIAALFVFGSGFSDTGSGPIDLRYIVKLSLVFINAILFLWLPLRRPPPPPKKAPTPVKAFDERTRV